MSGIVKIFLSKKFFLGSVKEPTDEGKKKNQVSNSCVGNKDNN